jgi:predicted nucleotidyltransferase
MVKMNQIEEFGRRLGREFQPEKIILFGSYARGEADTDSDVDVLVILPFEGKSVKKAVEIRLKLRPPFPLDLIVRTPENIQERLEMGDDFIREILNKGKVLYETDHQ